MLVDGAGKVCELLAVLLQLRQLLLLEALLEQQRLQLAVVHLSRRSKTAVLWVPVNCQPRHRC